MRAIYLRGDKIPQINSLYDVKDDRANHLIKVCRLKEEEEVLLIDGQGMGAISVATTITKRSISLKIEKTLTNEFNQNIDICIGLPKKEAFEQILKNATEMGVRKIIPYKAEYSQWDIKNRDRISSLLESAIIQSNNYYMPEVTETIISLKDILDLASDYDQVGLLSLKNSTKIEFKKDMRTLLFIGPEAGFSEDEERELLDLENSVAIRLKTPILRAPNAVSAALGYILGQFDAL